MSGCMKNRKKYEKEIELIKTKIGNSKAELELTPSITSERKREFKNCIALAKSQLKAIEDKIVEEGLEEGKEIKKLGDSFKKSDMIPRTPLKSTSDENTLPDMIPATESQEVERRTLIVSTASATIGVTSTPSVSSSATIVNIDKAPISSLASSQSGGAIPKIISKESIEQINIQPIG